MFGELSWSESSYQPFAVSRGRLLVRTREVMMRVRNGGREDP
jgi:hypothetical protein